MTQTINVNLIDFDTNQVRKSIPKEGIEELAQTIKSVGLIQPISVRVNPSDNDRYIVVCGERRLRAVMHNESEFIEANVLSDDLSDADIMNLQIIENLQRSEVHPLEEAIAYSKMKDELNLSIKEISNQVGKTERFIARRLHLVNLIEEIKEVFLSNRIKEVTAFRLSRLNDSLQREIYLEQMCGEPDDEIDLQDFQIRRKEQSLSNAPFDLSDESLLENVGACTNCKHNSRSSSLLFNDDDFFCTNSPCYELKEKAEQSKLVEEIVKENLIVVKSPYTYGYCNKIETLLADTDVTILSMIGVDMLLVPVSPNVPERAEWMDDDDWSEAESDYKEALEEFQSKQLAYEEMSKNESLQPMIFLNNSKLLRVQGIVLKSNSDGKEGNKEIIEGIQKREERKKELDREKVYSKVLDSIDGEVYSKNGDALKKQEIIALLTAIGDSLKWDVKRSYLDLLGVYDKVQYVSDGDLYKCLDEVLTYENFTKVINRAFRFMIRQFINGSKDDKSNSAGVCGMEIAKIVIPELVTDFENEQNEIIKKREERMNERISKLQA